MYRASSIINIAFLFLVLLIASPGRGELADDDLIATDAFFSPQDVNKYSPSRGYMIARSQLIPNILHKYRVMDPGLWNIVDSMFFSPSSTTFAINASPYKLGIYLGAKEIGELVHILAGVKDENDPRIKNYIFKLVEEKVAPNNQSSVKNRGGKWARHLVQNHLHSDSPLSSFEILLCFLWKAADSRQDLLIYFEALGGLISPASKAILQNADQKTQWVQMRYAEKDLDALLAKLPDGTDRNFTKELMRFNPDQRLFMTSTSLRTHVPMVSYARAKPYLTDYSDCTESALRNLITLLISVEGKIDINRLKNIPTVDEQMVAFFESYNIKDAYKKETHDAWARILSNRPELRAEDGYRYTENDGTAMNLRANYSNLARALSLLFFHQLLPETATAIYMRVFELFKLYGFSVVIPPADSPNEELIYIEIAKDEKPMATWMIRSGHTTLSYAGSHSNAQSWLVELAKKYTDEKVDIFADEFPFFTSIFENVSIPDDSDDANENLPSMMDKLLPKVTSRIVLGATFEDTTEAFLLHALLKEGRLEYLPWAKSLLKRQGVETFSALHVLDGLLRIKDPEIINSNNLLEWWPKIEAYYKVADPRLSTLLPLHACMQFDLSFLFKDLMQRNGVTLADLMTPFLPGVQVSQDIQANSYNFMTYAVKDRREETLSLLLSMGGKFANAIDNQIVLSQYNLPGETRIKIIEPLFYAQSCPWLLRLLLEDGADINRKIAKTFVFDQKTGQKDILDYGNTYVQLVIRVLYAFDASPAKKQRALECLKIAAKHGIKRDSLENWELDDLKRHLGDLPVLLP